MSRSQVTRREMIAGASTALASMYLAQPARGAGPNRPKLSKVVIGLVADVHQDIIHDGRERVAAFVDEAIERNFDAAVQLGDFALPHKHNQPFLDKWNEYQGPKHHVLGNHDTDHGFSKTQTMEWWGMPARYYSFDIGGWHFIVLDGNDKNPGAWSGYVRYVAQDQLDWLAKDLASTDAPVVVFSHQKLESDRGVANSDEVRTVLERANQDAGWDKVIACFCGHHHTDGLTKIKGIRYIHVNSMSYKWVGGGQKRQRFAKHIDQAHPWVSHTCPYRDPLYTTLTLDPESGQMSIEGKQTVFIPPTPADMSLPNASEMQPVISSRELSVLKS